MNLQVISFDTSQTKQSISIIVPCFNESEGVEHLKKKVLPLLADLRSLGTVELICVDDGSTDDTFSKLHQSFGGSAKIICHPKNKGLLAAIRTGLAHSTGNIICTIDSDCTYDPKQLKGLLDLMLPGVDIVTASPYHPKGGVQNVPAWRLFLSKGLSQLYGLVLPQKLYTYTSMFRAYRREVIETIPITYPGFLGMVEILAEAMFRGYRVVEYPAELGSRVFGQSKMRVGRVILSHLKYITKLIVRQFFYTKNTKLMRYKYTHNN